jgi:hypothetical protein
LYQGISEVSVLLCKTCPLLESSCFGTSINSSLRMQSEDGMLHRVALVGTDILDERTASTRAHSVLRLLISANTVPSSLIFITLMMVAICFFEMSVHTRAT